MKVLVIVLLAAVAIQAAPRSDLKDPLTRYPIYQQLIKNVDEKIINGTQVTDETKHPHQVWIYMDSSYFCGGSIVAANKVLTAAHCVADFTDFEITAGDIDMNDPSGSEQKRFANKSTVAIHPNWRPNILLGDLAVITLTDPFVLNGVSVAAIQLEKSNTTANLHAGETASISGYGKTSDTSGVSPVLNEVDGVPIITNAVCAQTFGNLVVNAGVICLDSKNGGSCNGDSGGPLSQGTGKDRIHIGLVSFGSSSGCSSAPIGFTRTAYYRLWIEEQLTPTP